MKKWFCSILIFTEALTYADTIVVPNKDTDVDGPEEGLIFLQPGQDRIQQVYDSSDFANVPPGGILISNFSWRVDQHGGSAFDITFDDVEVRASTTSRTFGTVSVVSATFVARMTRASSEGTSARSCSSLSRAP